jgi:polyvinyl alcohol dehydrogenase (cytochrome)
MPLIAMLLRAAWGLLLLLQHVSADYAGAPAQAPNDDGQWSGWGGNLYNNRWAPNTDINSTTVGNLLQNCKFDYPLGVSATPVVLNRTVYYPTANGSFYALDYGTCKYLWEVNVAAIIFDFAVPTAIQANNTIPASRTSPQIDGNVLFFATQAHALLVALDLHTGALLATIQVNAHPLAIVTMSPTVYDGKIFVGTSSDEESATLDPSYPCCNFIGNFAAYAFDPAAKKFTQVWEVNTLPAGEGWSGVGVWGSQPSIDPVRNQVFIGTGNTYVYPIAYEHCVNETAGCLPDDVWQESIIALDIPTGKVNWRRTISPLDGWVMVCGNAGSATSLSPLCPAGPGPDSDFAMAPTFVPAALSGSANDTVVVGQKNGNVYSVNAVTGDFQWVVTVGASHVGSWLSWGIAVDNANIFYTAINYASMQWAIQPSGVTIGNSAWGSLDLKAGAPVWATPCPDGELAYSPPGIINDLLFVGQSGSSKVNVSGAVLALSKTTGSVVHTIPVDTVQDGGIMAQGGFVMFGTGYQYRNPFEYGSFYVFGLPDAIAEANKPTSTTARPAASSVVPPKKKNSANRMNVAWTALYPLALLAICMLG